MRIESIKIKNFKNLQGEFKLNPHINLIIGNNGEGKTNFLEAVYYLGRAESFRHNNDFHLLKWERREQFLKVEADVKSSNNSGKNFSYIISDDLGILKKVFKIDGLKLMRSKYRFNFPVLLLSPQDLEIINGGPETRRNELDNFLQLIDSDYADVLSRYKKVLKQRNKLLKLMQLGQAQADELDFWNRELIDNGSKIVYLRSNILNEFDKYLKALAQSIFNGSLKSLDIDYVTKFANHVGDENILELESIKKVFEHKIRTGNYKEIASGQTLYGPQRDDLIFRAGKINLHESGSRGQQRLAALIFKLAMWSHLNSTLSLKPILLLDDIMSELDDKHKLQLEKCLIDLDTQLIFTSTTREHFSKELLDLANYIAV